MKQKFVTDVHHHKDVYISVEDLTTGIFNPKISTNNHKCQVRLFTINPFGRAIQIYRDSTTSLGALGQYIVV
jgi:hypothetical protein